MEPNDKLKAAFRSLKPASTGRGNQAQEIQRRAAEAQQRWPLLAATSGSDFPGRESLNSEQKQVRMRRELDGNFEARVPVRAPSQVANALQSLRGGAKSNSASFGRVPSHEAPPEMTQDFAHGPAPEGYDAGEDEAVQMNTAPEQVDVSAAHEVSPQGVVARRGLGSGLTKKSAPPLGSPNARSVFGDEVKPPKAEASTSVPARTKSTPAVAAPAAEAASASAAVPSAIPKVIGRPAAAVPTVVAPAPAAALTPRGGLFARKGAAPPVAVPVLPEAEPVISSARAKLQALVAKPKPAAAPAARSPSSQQTAPSVVSQRGGATRR